MIFAIFFAFLPALQDSPTIRGPVVWTAERARAGRWFPLAIGLRSDAAWEGFLEAQIGENGALSRRSVRLEPGREKLVLLPVLAGGSGDEALVVRAGESRASFPPLPLGPGPNRLLLVSRSKAASLRDALAGKWGNAEDLSRAPSVEPGDLPLDLYLLDAADWLFVHEDAAAALAPEAKDFLLRWAAIRGRLFSTEEGKRRFAPPRGLEGLIEAPEAASAGRRLPLASLPPERIEGLRPRDFARTRDPAFWALLAYLGGALFLIGRRRPGSLSKLALFAGAASVVQAVPGVAWPARTPPWRTLVASEGSAGILVEDRSSGPSKPIVLKPWEALLLPRAGDLFRAEWGSEVRFSWLDAGERRAHSMLVLDRGGVERAAGGSIRNRLAPLADASWIVEGMPLVGFRSELEVGEVLSPAEASPPGPFRPPRPLRDFLAADWVSGEWLSARIAGEDPTAGWMPLGVASQASYLVWFPAHH